MRAELARVGRIRPCRFCPRPRSVDPWAPDLEVKKRVICGDAIARASFALSVAPGSWRGVPKANNRSACGVDFDLQRRWSYPGDVQKTLAAVLAHMLGAP